MNIPKRWDEVLDALHRGGFPEALVAGGALRDLDHGVAVKDIDVFIASRWREYNDLKKAVDGAMGYEGVSIFEEPEPNLDEDHTWEGVGVAGIWNYPYRAPRNVIDTSPVPDGMRNALLDARDYGLDNPRPPFQVIALDLPPATFAAELLDDFDIGLCKIGYIDQCLYWQGDYEDDKRNKTLTVVKAPSYDALQRTRMQLGRIQLKYPNHRIVIPPDTLAMEKAAEVTF